MKKKLLIIILSIYVVIPCVINAKTYYQAKDKVSDYMFKNFAYVSSYEKYIYTPTNSLKFYQVYSGSEPEYNEDHEFIDGFGPENEILFAGGGLLSKNEFEISDTRYDDRGNKITGVSYLYSATPFWTLTSKEGSPSEKYVVDSMMEPWHDKYTDEQTKSIEIKATEYVKPQSRVSGAGTYSDPWYFNPIFKISISVNDPTKGKIIVNDVEKNKQEFIYDGASIESAFKVKSIESGYNYLGNTCPSMIIDKGDDTFSISNVTSDVSCLINFGVSQYNVVFNPGNCLGTLSGTTNPMKNVLFDEKVRLNNNSFNCQGYTFKGWNTQADGSGTAYDNQQEVDKLCSENNCVVNLYAQWENVTSVVKLNQAGATTPSNPEWEEGFAITFGSNVPNLTSVPKKEFSISFAGTDISSINSTYNFEGFYLDGVAYIDKNGNGSIWDKRGTDFELMAVWTGGEITLPTLSEAGKIFEGWYSSANFTEFVGKADDIYYPKANTTLYPKFTDITYDIVFNGGNCPSTLTGNMSSNNMYDIKFTSQETLPINTFECEGYNFNGWLYNNSKFFGDGVQILGREFNENPTGDFVANLYAQWIKVESNLFEDFNDDDMNPGFSYSTSNFSRSSNQYRITNADVTGHVGDYFPAWGGWSSGIIQGVVKITFTPAYDGKLSFDYGEANLLRHSWEIDATLNGQTILDINQWNMTLEDRNSKLTNIPVTGGQTYELVVGGFSYDIYNPQLYIDNLLVEYNN